MRYDITRNARNVERLIMVEKDERRRKMLENLRMHGLLENAGRPDEVTAPQFMVDHPVYTFRSGDGTQTVEGMPAINGLYHQIVDSGINVTYSEESNVGFTDWGLMTEGLIHFYLPGSALADSGGLLRETAYEIDDPSAFYMESRRAVVLWRYDDDVRLIGEDCYIVKPHAFRKLEPDEVWTPKEAAEALAPVIDNYPFYKG